MEQINGNSHLSEQYLQLARDLDVMEAKTPEDVYKSHLVEGRAGDGPSIDSARQNLASTFVNAFVNAGFGQDKLVTATPESSSEVRDFLDFHQALLKTNFLEGLWPLSFDLAGFH